MQEQDDQLIRDHHRLTRQRLLVSAGGLGLSIAGVGALAAGARAANWMAYQDVRGTIKFANYQNWIGSHEYARLKKRYPNLTVKEVYTSDWYGLIARLAAGAANVDMLLLTTDQLGGLRAAGQATTIPPGQVPNRRLVLPRFISEFKRYGIPTDTGRLGILYRKDLVKERIRTWKDFYNLIPRYPGKFSIQESSRTAIDSAGIAVGVGVNVTGNSEIRRAEALLRKVKKDLGPILFIDLPKRVILGDIYAGMVWDFEAAISLPKNKNLVWVDPADGLIGVIEGWVPWKGSKNLDAVFAFMDFHLEPKNYADFINTVFASYVESPATIGRYLKPAIRNNPILFPSAKIRKRIVYQKYLGDAQRLVDDAWARVKSG